MKYPNLFSKGRIGRLKPKNRLVMAPMVRNYAEADGRVSSRYLAHIERIARGGVGTMIIEASYVEEGGKGFVRQLGIHDDKMVPGLKRLTAAAHKHGALIGIQLFHGGRQASSQVSGSTPIAPSPIPDPVVNELPLEMSVKDIRRVVRSFGAAAKRAKAAGFDFVEIHGAHGYLITQFLSPFSNRRADEYGGTSTARLRFLKEVYAEVRKAVGKAFPVTLRLSGTEYVPDGLMIEDTVDIAREMEKLGVAALHITAGNYASYAKGVLIPPMAMQDGLLVPLAAKTRKAVDIPVIAVAKIRSPKMAERIIASGKADFVALGRTLLADPDFPKKIEDGDESLVNACTACNQGCIGRLFAQQDVWCTVNAECGREQLFAPPAKRSRRILVVGGGPAGLSAARTAAMRGHRVDLFEMSGELGGQLQIAGALPYREEWERLRQKLIADVGRLGVIVHLSTAFEAEMARGKGYDHAIVAAGSSAIRPNIPGVGRVNVVSSRDLLEGRAQAKGKVMVVGGGCAGAQTAEHLVQKGHAVTLVEATGDIAADAPIDDRTLLLKRLDTYGVRIMRDTKLMTIGAKNAVVENHVGTMSLPVDTVVLCLGSFPNNGFTDELRSYVKRVDVVGDAMGARRVTDAIIEGAVAVVEAENARA